jgi:hypothetical protein
MKVKITSGEKHLLGLLRCHLIYLLNSGVVVDEGRAFRVFRVANVYIVAICLKNPMPRRLGSGAVVQKHNPYLRHT